MMCQADNVVSPFLLRVSIGALAATAWLMISIGVPESRVDEVCGHAANARIAIRAWSTCEEWAYRGDMRRRRGGAEVELRQHGPRGKLLTHFQCRS